MLTELAEWQERLGLPPPEQAQTAEERRDPRRVVAEARTYLTNNRERMDYPRYRREGLPLDFAKIFKAAATTGTALEINAGYPRLDLNETNARGAIDAGCVLAIDTDAHSIEGFDEIDLGIGVARRAWATAKNVINCWTFAELSAFLGKKRGR